MDGLVNTRGKLGLAPVVIFTFNRLDHTRRTIDALAKNYLACQSNIIVYSDAPRAKDQEWKVRQVRNYLRGVTGFKSVRLIEREANMGLARSIVDGVATVVQEYGRVIVLEDDMETSPYFLKYMNDALDMYENDERVVCVHGYLYPVKAKLPETFFLKGADCWGWATWRRGWGLYEPDGDKLLRELRARRLERQFDFGGSYSYTKMLERQVNGENDSWAVRWYASAFLKDKLTLYPGRSLVRNIGHDGTGYHCGVTDSFDSGLSEVDVPVKKIPVEECLRAKKVCGEYFATLKPSFFQKIAISMNKRRGLLSGLFNAKHAGYRGNFMTWEDAERISYGYDNSYILDKVTEAMIDVRDGRAAFERGSVTFDAIQYSWPLLAALLWIASIRHNSLRLVDFGGSLGSSYYQNIGFLKHLEILRWNIVEQEGFVVRGSEEFTNEHLRFFSSIDECLKNGPCEAVLLASVLPYVKEPYELLRQIVMKGFSYVIIDRTPVLDADGDCLTVQYVPDKIYRASYPAWFLSRKKLLDFFDASGFELVIEFDSLVKKIKLKHCDASEKGFLFKRLEVQNGK